MGIGYWEIKTEYMACLSYIIDRSPSVNMGYYARHVSMQFTLERRLIKMELEGCDYQVNGLRFCSSRIYMYVYTSVLSAEEN